VAYRERRRGESVAICDLPDGTRVVTPAWMLDRAACAALTRGVSRCSLDALRDLRRLLDALAFEAAVSAGASSRAEVDDD
jgi:hypothetical protein